MKPTSTLFADRMNCIPESFIREILKVASAPNVISFAGGLPNPDFFPIVKLAEAAEKVIMKDGRTAFQYAPTEGFLPLRDYLADRQSSREGIKITPEQVIILNGSQQGLDLAGKLFCDKGGPILLEEPSYLGAIQAFSAYQPSFHSVTLFEDGPDPMEFTKVTKKARPAFFYCIPNFQNPTGYSYSESNRVILAESAYHPGMLWVEDNPYGEIFFEKPSGPDFHSLIPEKTLYLGSFSKIVSPGMRLGWATGPSEIIKKLTIAKQASDLHSNHLAQRIIYRFLCDNSLDEHLASIRTFYRGQRDTMLTLLNEHFPPEVQYSIPDGGMFLWVTLPEQISATSLLERSLKHDVIFVPGDNFYIHPEAGKNTLRLNFSNPGKDEMQRGLRIIGRILNEMLLT